MFDEPYELTHGPQQKREPEQLESWQKELDRRCPPRPEPQPRAA